MRPIRTQRLRITRPSPPAQAIPVRTAGEILAEQRQKEQAVLPPPVSAPSLIAELVKAPALTGPALGDDKLVTRRGGTAGTLTVQQILDRANSTIKAGGGGGRRSFLKHTAEFEDEYETLALARAALVNHVGYHPPAIYIGGFRWKKYGTSAPSFAMQVLHRGYYYIPGENEIDPAMWETPLTGVNVKLQQVLDTAADMGVPFNGHWRQYGIGTPVTLKVNAEYKGLSIKDEGANTSGSTNRQVVWAKGTQAASAIAVPGEWIKLECKVDRNGDGAHGHSNLNNGIRLDYIDHIELKGEAYGNNLGRGCLILGCMGGTIDFYAHDIFVDRVVYPPVDDDHEGIRLANCSNISGRARCENFGAIDRTLGVDRYAYCRAYAQSSCYNCHVVVTASEADQLMDCSGDGQNVGCTYGGSHLTYGRAVGFKHGNTGTASLISGLYIAHCGVQGIIVSSSGGDTPTDVANAKAKAGAPQDILITGNVIRNTGSGISGSVELGGASLDISGINIRRNIADSPVNRFPRGVYVTNNQIYCDSNGTEAATYTVSGSELVFDAVTKPMDLGMRVTSSETGGTSYWLVPTVGSNPFRCRLAATWTDAIDLGKGRTTRKNQAGATVAVTPLSPSGIGLTGGTLTLQQDMQYLVATNDITPTTAKPIIFKDNYGSGTVATVSGGVIHEIGRIYETELGVGTPLPLTDNVPANVFAATEVGPGIYEAEGFASFEVTGSTNYTQLFVSVSTTSATLDSSHGREGALCNSAGVVPGNRITLNTGRSQLTLTGATNNVYLVAYARFTVSTLGVAGKLRLRCIG